MQLGTVRVIVRLLLLVVFIVTGGGCARDPAGNLSEPTATDDLEALKSLVALTSIAVSPLSTSLPANTTQALTAVGTSSNGKTKKLTNSATWASTDPTVATVSSAGLVTAAKPGTVTITATSGTVTGTATITVTTATMVSVAVTPVSRKLPIGTSLKYTATANVQ